MEKALFLDRDGVINVDHGYVYKPQDFKFIPGVFDACKKFTDAGYKLIIVTNQSGIGRGYYTESQFAQLTDWMVAQFAAHHIPVTDVYFCPHHPKKAIPAYLKQCACRKPEPGMLLQGIRAHNLDPNLSIMVGDKLSDVEAAKRAGIKMRVLVRSGQHFNEAETEAIDYICDSLAELPSLMGLID